MYRVFLGAPSKSDLQDDPQSYSWHTFSSSSGSKVLTNRTLQPSFSSVFPLATLEAASARISLVYKNLTFRDEGEDEADFVLSQQGSFQDILSPAEVSEALLGDQTTLYTWPPTAEEEVEALLGVGAPLQESEHPADEGVSEDPSQLASKSQLGDASIALPLELGEEKAASGRLSGIFQDDVLGPTNLLAAQTEDPPEPAPTAPAATGPRATAPSRGPHESRINISMFNMSGSIMKADSQPSQSAFLETQEESFGDSYSDASSIARFPQFHFNPNTLTSLAQLSPNSNNKAGAASSKSSKKVNVLVAVLEVEGPDSIRIKKGADAGKEVSILKMILGAEDGSVCKLTAWREVAEEWGGYGEGVAVKRGDIVHIENVMATSEPGSSVSISASTYLTSKLTICFRTMPYTQEDSRLRPDLRLGESEPCVRRVAIIAQWFERMAGLRR